MSAGNRAIAIAGPAVRGEVQLLGGMAGPFTFELGGRAVRPFAIAPWADDPAEQLAGLPPLLRRLRGEWPCVPFGSVNPPQDLPPEWAAGRAAAPGWHRHDHGFSSHHEWVVETRSRGAVTLSIRFPDDHPIELLERRLVCHPSEPRLDISLTVTARNDVTLPIGLHPVFRLPETTGAAALELPADTRLWSFPVDVEPGKSAVAADQRGVAASALRAANGGALDITRLPLAGHSEDLLLATGTDGCVRLRNMAEMYAVTLRWNAADLPLCGLWLSNRGRAFYPWNGRFNAIGIEPVAAPFDLGPALAANNPLSRAGLATGVRLQTGQPWTTHYSISVATIDGGQSTPGIVS